MEALRYIVMGFGLVLALTGIALFVRKRAGGSNKVKVLGRELPRSGSALVLFIMGAVTFVLPLSDDEKLESADQSPAMWAGWDGSESNAEASRPADSGTLAEPRSQADNAASAVDVSNLQAQIRALVAEEVKVDPETVDAHKPLVQQPFGFDELALIAVLGQIEMRFGVAVPLDTDHASIDTLARDVEASLRAR